MRKSLTTDDTCLPTYYNISTMRNVVCYKGLYYCIITSKYISIVNSDLNYE